MATVTAFIRAIKSDKSKPANVRFRLRDGRSGIDKKTGKDYGGIQIFYKSELTVVPDKWDATHQKIKTRCLFDDADRKSFDTAVDDRKKIISRIHEKYGKSLTSEILHSEIDLALNPPAYDLQQQSFFQSFDDFLFKHQLSEVRRKNFRVVYRCLQRFELYVQITSPLRMNRKLELDNFTPETLQSFSDFLKKEHEYFDQYPDLYLDFPEYHKQKPRGQNTVNDILVKLRTFFLWSVKNKKTSNRPFDNFKIDECVYGTPFYISTEERNRIYDLDLSNRPALELQRNIFIFQCCIGLRVQDLYNLTRDNIIDGEVHYIARKTKDGKPKTVKVPLNRYAKEILNKYAHINDDRLFPFISQQKYNVAIKQAFLLAGITRNVVICDPITRENVIRPINEVASSHLARRCFIGNMYAKAKDQNLVAELSGHKQNSKAFARYREVNRGMRNELVQIIE